MDFSLKQLQLEHIAFIKVSAMLWNQYDIRTLVIDFSNTRLFTRLDTNAIRTHQDLIRKEWQKIEDRVMGNVLQLMIPSCLNEKISSFIQVVGMQILKWLEYHRKFCNLDLDLPNEFCWTPHGIVDKKETSKFLIKDDNINIATRYKLACFYCIEDNILELWNKMNESDKLSLYNDKNVKNSSQKIFLDFWKYYIIGDLDTFQRKYYFRRSCHERMLEYASCNSNKAAIKYFLERINTRKEISLLVITFQTANAHQASVSYFSNQPPKEYLSEILCFLLSQMNNEQQMEVFEKDHFEVLCALLEWPFQRFFVETASRLLNFLPEIPYDALLRAIIRKTHLGYKDYAYCELFRDFWQIIPQASKNDIINDFCTASLLYMQLWIKNKIHIIKDSCIASLLDMLLWIKDKENLKLVFQNATVIQKHKFIFSEGCKNVCENLISVSEDWDLFGFFLKLCISTKDEMVQFKDEFVTHLQARRPQRLAKSKFDEFCLMLNNLVNEYDKRKCTEDGDSGPAKRLCCIEFKDTA